MNLNTLTTEERERWAYAEGFTETAALLGELSDLEQERDTLTEELEELEPFTEELQQELKALREFFSDCFERLAGHYPCPSVNSDYDKNVIFEAIERGEGATE
jgi:predicted nuclease with TOPRIM domain